MSKLNWRKAQTDGMRKTSTADEREWREKDAAARWLERNEKRLLPLGRRRKSFNGARP